MKLRYYQTDAVKAAIKDLSCHKNPLLVLPTGAGKSLIIAELCRQLQGKQILVITPRIKLLQQNSKLIDNTGILSGLLGSDTGADHSVVCATFQTLLRREHKTPDICFIDEAHLVPESDKSAYGELLGSYKGALFVGLTATPFKGRSRIFEGVNSRWLKSYEIGLLVLIREGYLVPPRSYKTHAYIDKQNLSDDENTVITQNIMKVASAKLNSLGCKKTLVFCRDIEHIHITVDALKKLNKNTLFVHSEQSKRDQNQAYKNFESAETAWLVNCNMVTTGVDLPFVDSLILLRQISEGGLYIQIIGRGLRTHPSKSDCAILDYGDNRRRFGAIDKPTFLESQDGRGGNHGNFTREKACPDCELLNVVSAKKCEGCGFVFFNGSILDVQSTDKNVLSIDVRKSTIVDINFTPVSSLVKIQYIFDNGDQAHDFVKKKLLDTGKVKKRIGLQALYRVSGGVSKIINR